jgi:hypothetical protein
MTTYIYFYGKHKMLKTENPFIFTCFEDESYFSCLTFTNNKRVLFSASGKECDVCDLFYYLLRSGVAGRREE